MDAAGKCDVRFRIYVSCVCFDAERTKPARHAIEIEEGANLRLHAIDLRLVRIDGSADPDCVAVCRPPRKVEELIDDEALHVAVKGAD